MPRVIALVIWICLGSLAWTGPESLATASQASGQEAEAVPVPPMIAGFERFGRHDELTPETGGNLLVSELSCTACHVSQATELEPKSGPKLEAVGRRVRAEWLADYLSNPSSTKPGTTMPDMLGHLSGANKDRSVSALVSFLVSQQAAFPELKATGLNPVPHEFWNKGRVEVGEQLLHQAGCVACHEPSPDYEAGSNTTSSLDQLLEQLDPDQIAKLGLANAMRSVPSVPLPDLRRKYTPQGLTHFLLDPAHVRPAGRMPGMKLGTVEAADIAAYLRSRSSTTVPSGKATPTSAALREEGRRLFSELGCVQCHSATGVQARAKSKPLRLLKPDSERNCLSANRHAGVPHFELDALQRQSIQAALKSEQMRPANAKSSMTPAARLDLALMQLNCLACHQRDNRGGVARGRDRYFETRGQVDLGDEGRLPPPLTHVGRKLQASWMKVVLQGNGEQRPHLQIRMPKYPMAEVEPLISQLASVDKSNAAAKPKEAIDGKLAEAGRQLFNLGCVQCHPVRGEALPAVIGVDVGRIGGRVHRDWFEDFLRNPASLKPRTRMPTFFAEGSINKEILDGDVGRQIAALWIYLEDIANQPLPDKIEQARRQNFELVPSERPIVLRTFMERAGTHAIAVGFAEKNHYAFDSESLRMAEVWSGRFLDAQGTWNDRFTPPAVPLSRKRVGFPSGPEFALINIPKTLTGSGMPAWPSPPLNGLSHWASPRGGWRFLGYQLDATGVPTLRYQIGEYTVRDRMASGPAGPDSSGRMTRELEIHAEGSQPALWFRVAVGPRPLKPESDTLTTETGMKIRLPKPLADQAIVRESAGQAYWLLPIPVADSHRVSIEYRW